MSTISTAVKHPIPSLAVAGFTVYASYWAIEQVHWLVSHAFTVLLFAALITVALTVGGKIKARVTQANTTPAGAIGTGVTGDVDWDRLVREYDLPHHA